VNTLTSSNGKLMYATFSMSKIDVSAGKYKFLRLSSLVRHGQMWADAVISHTEQCSEVAMSTSVFVCVSDRLLRDT